MVDILKTPQFGSNDLVRCPSCRKIADIPTWNSGARIFDVPDTIKLDGVSSICSEFECQHCNRVHQKRNLLLVTEPVMTCPNCMQYHTVREFEDYTQKRFIEKAKSNGKHEVRIIASVEDVINTEDEVCTWYYCPSCEDLISLVSMDYANRKDVERW